MILTGNYAVAQGVKAARAEVVAAYPITPQTQIIEKLSEFITKGDLRARYIRVESEHSAMAACISAEACGARSFTATSSHGLAYMNEMVVWAGLGRFPITMAVVTRTMAPPWSIWNEHSDLLAQRDSGWIILMCSSAQEAYDTAIQAYRIAEDEKVLQPVMYGLDAFYLSHTAEDVDLAEQKIVDAYLPRLDPERLPVYLDPDNPATFGNMLGPDMMMEFRNVIRLAMLEAKGAIEEAAAEYGKATARPQVGLLENYRCNDAEVAILAMGASCGDAKDAVDSLRDKGIRAGLLRLRAIRPFPGTEAAKVLAGAKAVAVVDRDYSYGYGGIIGGELKAYRDRGVCSYVAGLGGRDITNSDFEGIATDALHRVEEAGGGAEHLEEVWWGLKEAP
jgi:pyruvate/2-oxoacid:ferredoxin oxidoreductase alpha subunit